LRCQLKASTAHEVRRLLSKEIPASWSKRDHLHKLLDDIVARGAPITANRVRAWLGKFFEWAKGRDIIAINPVSDIDRPASEMSRDRVLSDSELKSVWIASESLGFPYKEFIRLLILTSARLSEVAGLRWSELDIENRLWILPGSRTKNGREHVIPISDMIIDILRDAQRRKGRGE
jgi:integrase